MQKTAVKFLYLSAIFLLLPYLKITAQTQPVSLERAVSLALENNAELKRQAIILQASERAAKYSWNTAIPNVSVSAADTYSADKTQKLNEVSLSGNASLNIRADIFGSMNKSRIDHEVEKLNYSQLCAQIKSRVVNSYLEIISFQQEIAYRTEALKNTRALYEENADKYRKGFISENECLISKIACEKQKVELNGKKQELKTLVHEFCGLTGIQFTDEVVFSTSLDSIYGEVLRITGDSYADRINACIKNKTYPSAVLLNLQKEAAVAELKTKKIAVWSPSLDVSYTTGPLFDERKYTSTVTAGVNLSLDSFLGCSAARQEVRNAEDSVRDLEIQIQSREKETASRVGILLLELADKKETAEAYESFVKITKQNYQLCKKQYNSGMLDFQAVKTASTELLDSQIDYAGMIAGVVKTFMEIQETAGLDFTVHGEP